MASFHESKAARTAQTKAVVARAKARAPPPGPVILAAILSLACFLVSDYLLFDDTPCDVDFSPQTYLQSHLWTSQNGWIYYTISRVLLCVLVFVVFCVALACLLGLCGVKWRQSPNKDPITNITTIPSYITPTISYFIHHPVLYPSLVTFIVCTVV
ncbi:hypothetical protein GBAR_LOCUS26704 [Geodia barretti]|uniref:Transmembrane protein n=1 Tax=Geodia barretti TaxID=519541 RepID=A0AA35X8Q3_GEOBA|nr:hypothetical protein GBAR_LOCUS26704 [Geodia barretti]